MRKLSPDNLRKRGKKNVFAQIIQRILSLDSLLKVILTGGKQKGLILYLLYIGLLYSKISDTDFRRKMFKAPAGTALDGATAYIYPAFADAYFPTYTSVKFRPGSGDIEDYTVGASTSFPIMRIEEMYSPSTQMYRFKNCWGFGTDVLFTWDGAEKVVVKPAIVSTGYVHPSYGVITANYYNDYTYAVVDPETNAVQMAFAIEFTVAAGSFGSYYNTFEFVKPN